jgi:methyl-accepting chemotaxis protein
MADSGRVEGSVRGPQENGSRPRFRRRRFLVDPGHQVRVGIAAVGITLVLLLLLDASLLVGGRAGSDTGTGDLGGMETVLVAAGSLVFVAGVFIVSILETHRTAGAARSLRATMDRFREGDLEVRARLRRGDHLQEVAAAFNALAGTLHEKSRAETARLEAIASRLATDPGEAERLLREFLEERRRATGSGV